MSIRQITYRNPVYPHYFADPFVLKVGGEYFAYGTAPAAENGMQFPVLRSRDLSRWEYVAHALRPLENPRAFTYWAPEVAQKDGRFLLYYSATTSESDEHHRLRVATSETPAGPFIDSGRELMPDAGFSIDAHPFHDPRSGRWYLFFAADYTGEEPYGTGLAAVALADDLTTVAGEPRAILRASDAWQIYQRNRNYKSRIWPAWNCVEGPFVLFHEGKYYCLYSGGAWNSENYGIGFAVADDVLGPYRDVMGRHGPTVLKGTPNESIGPGHNSVVIGPDDKTFFLVYHAWDVGHTARRMCIDPLRWTAAGPKCDGPTIVERTIQF
ncbi:MAG TPA: glycoside hydrolase family 43 protein [Tepidisphaeraceae bacterium]|jgi:beta-xylosidase